MSEPTIGAYLRAARRKRRVSIERAAEETRIRPDFLMRMESDEFDFLAPAYVRGFLRSYARYLRLKEDAFVEEFDRRFGPARMDTSQITAMERRQKRAPREPRRVNSWTAAGVFAALFLFLLAVVGLLTGDEDEPERRSSLAQVSPSPTTSPTLLTPTVSPSPSASPSAQVALEDGITFEVTAATAECWVDVTADGTKVFSDTLAVGQTETFEAAEGMTIILGFPSGVEMSINGRPITSPDSSDPLTIKLPEDLDLFL